VLSTAVAWPTLLLPGHIALISQFLAFNLLYNADSSTGRRGLTPPWYGKYRFVLTFIVGASILLTLVSKSHIGDSAAHLSGPLARLREVRDFAVHGEEEKELEDEEEAEMKEEKEESSK